MQICFVWCSGTRCHSDCDTYFSLNVTLRPMISCVYAFEWLERVDEWEEKKKKILWMCIKHVHLCVCVWMLFCACSCVNGSEWADVDESHTISTWLSEATCGSSRTLISHAISALVLFFFSQSDKNMRSHQSWLCSRASLIFPQLCSVLLPLTGSFQKRLGNVEASDSEMNKHAGEKLLLFKMWHLIGKVLWHVQHAHMHEAVQEMCRLMLVKSPRVCWHWHTKGEISLAERPPTGAERSQVWSKAVLSAWLSKWHHSKAVLSAELPFSHINEYLFLSCCHQKTPRK